MKKKDAQILVGVGAVILLMFVILGCWTVWVASNDWIITVSYGCITSFISLFCLIANMPRNWD